MKTTKEAILFGKDMDLFAKNITDKMLPDFVKTVALELLRRVVLKTPVGNPSKWANPSSAPPGYVGGSARGNWQVQEFTIPNDIKTKIDKGGETTIAAGSNIILRTSGRAFIYIINNLPYIAVLEEGQHSKQAPEGMVAISMQEVAAAFS